jgi:hypothetical protein
MTTPTGVEMDLATIPVTSLEEAVGGFWRAYRGGALSAADTSLTRSDLHDIRSSWGLGGFAFDLGFKYRWPW